MKRRHFLGLGAATTVSLVSADVWTDLSGTTGPRNRHLCARRPDRRGARLIAQKLSESSGRQFYVENVAGASGNIGTAQAAKAAPDGYTLLITVNNLVINPPLFGNVTYDPYKDFGTGGIGGEFSSAFAVHPSVPAKTVSELVNHIRPTPASSALSFRIGHTCISLVSSSKSRSGSTRARPLHGSGPAITATVAGHTPIGFASLSTAVPQAKDGKLRACGHEQDRIAVAA
jgi:tripartite-type tricarboxylate transporter receptor subunit TctC